MRKVKVYAKLYCPFCLKVIRYLKKENISFELIDVQNNESMYKKLKQKTGHHTVPQVFIDEEFIGGSTEFFDYLKRNKLSA